MSLIPRLDPGEVFPPSSEALAYPNGLLAAGNELTPELLLQAYRRGIFPWYEEPQPVLWWTPDPRSVLLPDEFHLSRSLRKTLRRDALHLSVDSAFAEVMHQCGATRQRHPESPEDNPGSWIGREMLVAYSALHQQGHAHSIEVQDATGALVGGLYGVALGRAFFGESMFSLQRDASKVAMVGLLHILRRGGFRLVDCQVESEHLNSLGARNISRLDFESLLAQTVTERSDPGIWTLPATCGGLL